MRQETEILPKSTSSTEQKHRSLLETSHRETLEFYATHTLGLEPEFVRSLSGEHLLQLGHASLRLHSTASELEQETAAHAKTKEELELAYEKVDKLLGDIREAYHDKVTGLMNRALFFKETSELEPDTRFLFGTMDLRGLKKINDSADLGHPAGDALLRGAAETLNSILPGAIIARVGGDEFWFMVPLGDNDNVEAIKDLIRDVFGGQDKGVVCALNETKKVHQSARVGFEETKASDIKIAINNAEKELSVQTEQEKHLRGTDQSVAFVREDLDQTTRFAA